MLFFDLAEIKNYLTREMPDIAQGFLVQHHHQRVLVEGILQRSDIPHDMRAVLFITIPNVLSLSYCVGKEKVLNYRGRGAQAQASYLGSSYLTARHDDVEILQEDLCFHAMRCIKKALMIDELMEEFVI